MTAADDDLTLRQRALLRAAAERDLRWYDQRLWEHMPPRGLLPLPASDARVARALIDRGLLTIRWDRVVVVAAPEPSPATRDDGDDTDDTDGHPDQARHSTLRDPLFAVAFSLAAALIVVSVISLAWLLLTGGWWLW